MVGSDIEPKGLAAGMLPYATVASRRFGIGAAPVTTVAPFRTLPHALHSVTPPVTVLFYPFRVGSSSSIRAAHERSRGARTRTVPGRSRSRCHARADCAENFFFKAWELQRDLVRPFDGVSQDTGFFPYARTADSPSIGRGKETHRQDDHGAARQGC
jgi:hypothetical protein